MNSKTNERLQLMRRLGFWNATSLPPQEIQVFTDPALQHRHDWGVFGEYQFLGPGTPATRKTQLGVEPVSELDRLAQEHDLYYARTNDWPATRSAVRGLVDYGAGSAMVLQSFNPWSDMSASERILGVGAGAALIGQGILRIHPTTALGAALFDFFFY